MRHPFGFLRRRASRCVEAAERQLRRLVSARHVFLSSATPPQIDFYPSVTEAYLVNLVQAGERLGISAKRVRQLIDTGQLTATKVGRGWELDQLDVVRFGKVPRRRGRPPSGGRNGQRRLARSEPDLVAFVSSVMRSDEESLAKFRRAAIEAIEQVPAFRAWAFEETGASSEAVDDSYLENVDRSDCVVWIVGRTLTQPVRKEINRALLLKKPILIFRCTDEATHQTEALIKRVGTKWMTTRDVSALSSGIWTSLQSELTRAYRQQKPVVELTALHRMEGESRSRMISRWLAAGVPIDLARQLVADSSVARPPPALSHPRRTPVTVLIAGPGAGKSSVAERLHQADIAHYRADGRKPIPMLIGATDYSGNLATEVRTRANDLGNIDETGISLIVDGADELEPDHAKALVRAGLEIVDRWPKSSVLLTTRPLLSWTSLDAWTPTSVDFVSLEPLSSIDSEGLITKVAGIALPPWTLRDLPDEVKASTSFPFFAVLLGVYLRERRGAPNRTGDLLALAARWSVDAGSIQSSRAEELMYELAVELMEGEGTPVLASTLTSSIAESSALRSTRILIETDGRLNFALPILTQWFAGQALLRGKVGVDWLLQDDRRLQRWLPAVGLAAQAGEQPAAQSIVRELARRSIALLPSILRAASVTTGAQGKRSEDSTAAELRLAMEAVKEGWGPLSQVLIPQRPDGSLAAVGVALFDDWLTVSWCRDAPRDIARVALPNFAHGQAWPSGWAGVRGAKTTFDAFWPWRWSMDHVRHGLKELLAAKPDFMAPSALRGELTWAAAIQLTGRGTFDPGPIPLGDLEHRLAPPPSPHGTPPIQQWPLRFQWLHDKVQQERAAGGAYLFSEWPGRDIHPAEGRWIWDFFSDTQTFERASRVYLAALDGYSELVDRWFTSVASRLATRVTLPAALSGVIKTHLEGGFIGMRWYLDPLPTGSTNELRLQLDTSGTRETEPDWRELNRVSDKLAEYRPHGAGWLHSTFTDQILRIFDLTPATDLVYGWLQSDLRALGWCD